jgi:hypothetical protein
VVSLGECPLIPIRFLIASGSASQAGSSGEGSKGILADLRLLCPFPAAPAIDPFSAPIPSDAPTPPRLSPMRPDSVEAIRESILAKGPVHLAKKRPRADPGRDAEDEDGDEDAGGFLQLRLGQAGSRKRPREKEGKRAEPARTPTAGGTAGGTAGAKASSEGSTSGEGGTAGGEGERERKRAKKEKKKKKDDRGEKEKRHKHKKEHKKKHKKKDKDREKSR